MPLWDPAKTISLNAVGQAATLVSVHTADPTSAGLYEVSGGGYTRRAISWNSVQPGGTMGAAVAPVFDVPGDITITHYGLWKSDGVTFLASEQVSNPETFIGPGQYTLASAGFSEA